MLCRVVKIRISDTTSKPTPRARSGAKHPSRLPLTDGLDDRVSVTTD